MPKSLSSWLMVLVKFRKSSRGAMAQVLIVEDHATNRKLFRDVLQLNGFSTAEAANSKEALDYFVNNSNTPKVIIVDVGLPGEMSGLELITHLAAPNKTWKIIAVTGYTSAEDRELIFYHGADYYLSKPVSLPEFIELVRQQFDLQVSAEEDITTSV